MRFTCLAAMILLVLSVFLDASFGSVDPYKVPRWTTSVKSLSAYGSDGRNFAQDVAIDSKNNTIVVGSFDGTIRVGDYTLVTFFPAAFIVKTNPAGTVLWAIHSDATPKPKTATIVTAYSVITSPRDDSVVVGGTFAAADVTFAGNDQKKHSLASYAKDSASFLLKISTSGVIQWLRGPLALDLQYVKAVEIDAHDDSVYAAGFYEGAVYFPPTFASLADASIVQGWLAKFSANGTLSWLTSLTGAGRNVVADLVLLDSGALALIGTYQADCNVTTRNAYNQVVDQRQLNGTASRAVLVASVDTSTGAWHWFQTAAAQSAVTCEEYHYVERALGSSDLYVSGCFSGALNFTALPNNATAAPTHVLDTGSPLNSIYVAKLFANGTLAWMQAMLGSNILDYAFALRSVSQARVTHANAHAAPDAGGVTLAAFVQGAWQAATRSAPLHINGSAHTLRPQCRTGDGGDVAATSTARGYGGELGSLYAATLDTHGCVTWIALLAYGRAQAGGVAQLSERSFAVFGTFSGTVSFGPHSNLTSTTYGRSADVFYAIVDVLAYEVLPTAGVTPLWWQYGALGAFALLFVVAAGCIACLYRQRDEQQLLLANKSGRSRSRGQRRKRRARPRRTALSSSSDDDDDDNLRRRHEQAHEASPLLAQPHDEDLGLAFAGSDGDEVDALLGIDQHTDDDDDDDDDDVDVDDDSQHDQDNYEEEEDDDDNNDDDDHGNKDAEDFLTEK